MFLRDVHFLNFKKNGISTQESIYNNLICFRSCAFFSFRINIFLSKAKQTQQKIFLYFQTNIGKDFKCRTLDWSSSMSLFNFALDFADSRDSSFESSTCLCILCRIFTFVWRNCSLLIFSWQKKILMTSFIKSPEDKPPLLRFFLVASTQFREV